MSIDWIPFKSKTSVPKESGNYLVRGNSYGSFCQVVYWSTSSGWQDEDIEFSRFSFNAEDITHYAYINEPED